MCKQRITDRAGQTSLDVVACTNHLWAATFPTAGRQNPPSGVKTFVVHLKIMGWAMILWTLPVSSVPTLPFAGSILTDVLLGRMMSTKGGSGAGPRKQLASRTLLCMWQEFFWLTWLWSFWEMHTATLGVSYCILRTLLLVLSLSVDKTFIFSFPLSALKDCIYVSFRIIFF